MERNICSIDPPLYTTRAISVFTILYPVDSLYNKGGGCTSAIAYSSNSIFTHLQLV
jgi:hypothetical protein